MENRRRQILSPGKNGAVWASVFLLFLLMAAARMHLFPVRAVIWHLTSIIWWIVILAVSLGQGSILFRVLGGRSVDLDGGMALAVSAGLGLGALSLETFFLGTVGLMSPTALTILILVLAVVAFVYRRYLASGIRETRGLLERTPAESFLPLTATSLTALCVLPFVLLPTRAFDALSYHLEVPMRFLEAGRVLDIPENLYSYAPMLTQMLYGLGLGLNGADLAGLIYYSFFLLSLWTLWRGGGLYFGSEGAAWAMAILALTPVFLMEVPNSGADWSMTCFILLSLFLLAGGKRDLPRLMLAGIMAGMAAGCRHQALVYAIAVPLAAGITDDLLSRRRPLAAPWLFFLAVAVTVASPWYIRNAVMTGDPIYPLFAKLSGRLNIDFSFVEGLVGSRSLDLLWSWILVPYRAVFDPQNLHQTATLGVIPLALLPLLPSLRGTGKGNRFLLMWAVLCFAAWYSTYVTLRYAMPVFAVTFLWLGAAVHVSMGKSGSADRYLKAALALALMVNGGIFVGLSDYANRSVGPALGTVTPQSYIRDAYDVYPALYFLNSMYPQPEKVLFVGEMRGFYAMFPREVPSHNMPNRLIEMAKNGIEPARMREQLVNDGFSHILVNKPGWDWLSNTTGPLWKIEGEALEVMNRFLEEHTERLYFGKGVSIYAINER